MPHDDRALLLLTTISSSDVFGARNTLKSKVFFTYWERSTLSVKNALSLHKTRSSAFDYECCSIASDHRYCHCRPPAISEPDAKCDSPSQFKADSRIRSRDAIGDQSHGKASQESCLFAHALFSIPGSQAFPTSRQD